MGESWDALLGRFRESRAGNYANDHRREIAIFAAHLTNIPTVWLASTAIGAFERLTGAKIDGIYAAGLARLVMRIEDQTLSPYVEGKVMSSFERLYGKEPDPIGEGVSFAASNLASDLLTEEPVAAAITWAAREAGMDMPSALAASEVATQFTSPAINYLAFKFMDPAMERYVKPPVRRLARALGYKKRSGSAPADPDYSKPA